MRLSIVEIRMNKNNDFFDTANKLIPSLRNDENEKAVNKIRVVDPFFSLKSSLFEFFQNMLQKVQTDDEFTKRVKDALIDKIEANDISVNQLLNLLDSVNKEKINLVDSILSIFKPIPGTGEVSPLIDPRISNNLSDSGPFTNLSTNERNVLDKLSRVLQVVNTEEDTDKE